MVCYTSRFDLPFIAKGVTRVREFPAQIQSRKGRRIDVEITITEYRLSTPLGGAPWFVHIFATPGRVWRVEILSAAEAADVFGGNESPWFSGTLTPCRNIRNAERAARRFRRATGAVDKVEPRRWVDARALEEYQRLMDID